MIARYCYGVPSACARLAAMAVLDVDDIPDDLLPTDFERLEQLGRLFPKKP
jgi:hypothetical protein